MPRGIPKDPNHPRNKTRKPDVAAAPTKKRGRPPGSKNLIAKVVEIPIDAPVAVHKIEPKWPDKSSPGKVISAHKTNDVLDMLDLVRTNISVLSHCQNSNSAAGSALTAQVALLEKLTAQALGTEEVVAPAVLPTAVAPVVVTPPPQLAPLPTPPNFSPPPFPTLLGQS